MSTEDTEKMDAFIERIKKRNDAEFYEDVITELAMKRAFEEAEEEMELQRAFQNGELS